MEHGPHRIKRGEYFFLKNKKINLSTNTKVLKARLSHGVQQVLVQWIGCAASEASCEHLTEFQQKNPTFWLEDELLMEGSDVMWVSTMSAGANPIKTPWPPRDRSTGLGKFKS